MYIVRIILVFLIIFLIVRAFIIAGSAEEPVNKESGTDKMSGGGRKGVPKSLGEYIDYEEVDKSA